MAAKIENIEIFELLIENVTNIFPYDNQDRTPLDIATTAGNSDILLLIMQKSSEQQLFDKNDEIIGFNLTKNAIKIAGKAGQKSIFANLLLSLILLNQKKNTDFTKIHNRQGYI